MPGHHASTLVDLIILAGASREEATMLYRSRLEPLLDAQAAPGQPIPPDKEPPSTSPRPPDDDPET